MPGTAATATAHGGARRFHGQHFASVQLPSPSAPGCTEAPWGGAASVATPPVRAPVALCALVAMADAGLEPQVRSAQGRNAAGYDQSEMAGRSDVAESIVRHWELVSFPSQRES